jgi:hypothetical protein
LCGKHFMQWRRSEDGMPPLPDIREARQRERLVRDELTLGCLGESQGIYPGNTMFANEGERREAWERHRGELTDEYEARQLGDRPDAWWRFVADRPKYLTPCPSEPGPHGLVKRVRWGHEEAVERFAWMAREGHLTGAELANIAERGAKARERVGTPRERKEALGDGYGGDRLSVAIADAVEAQS